MLKKESEDDKKNYAKNNNLKISIIIPIYNIEKWLYTCLDSVVRQTFMDYEVILVDDGSTDGSGEICDSYCKRDSRFSVFHKINEGTSKAKNLGLYKARGKYISFIDGDDWVEPTFLEKLLNMAEENDADIVECDYYRYNDKTGNSVIRISSGIVGQDYSLGDHIVYGTTSFWKCLFKKSLFIDNGIVFPECHSEGRAVYSLLIAKANNIKNVHEPLYYHRGFRDGSLTQKPRIRNGDENAIGVKAYRYLFEGFQRLGLYEKYKEELQRMVVYKLSDTLAGNFHRRGKRDYFLLVDNYKKFMKESFGKELYYEYIVVGGYNLNRVVWNMNFLHNPYFRFNFSSIISIMNPINGKLKFSNSNVYRAIMIERDMKSLFWDILKEFSQEAIIFDFMEERFDIIAVNGGYITKSDAFEETDIKIESFEIIERNSLKCKVLWEKSWDDFIKELKKFISIKKIIVVKSLLSEKVGNINGQYSYDQIEDIRRMNQILEEYYNYVAYNYPEISFVDMTEDALYFTDSKYEYGVMPSHLNELINRKIAKEVEKRLER